MINSCTLLEKVSTLWINGRGTELMRPMVLPITSGMFADCISLFSLPVFSAWWWEYRISPALTAVSASLSSPQPETTA